MQPLLVLKFVHVVAVVLALGANVTYAFWLSRARHDRDRILFAIEGVRRLDRRLANPSYVVVLITGVWMVLAGMYSFETGWIAVSIVLYVVVAIMGITLFAPAIRRQVAAAEADPAGAEYAAAARRTTLLAAITVATVLVIVFLMVTKPF